MSKKLLKGYYRLAQGKIISTYRRLNENDNYSEKITTFINNNNYSSSTSYLIYVDLKNYKTNIFKGATGNYKLLQSYLCAIGKPSTPTPTGTFKTGIKGLYFGVEKGYKCWYYTQFYRNYLFHSIIYNLDGSVKDGRLGMKISNGCVRLPKIHAKWIFDNIPPNTTVIIL